MSDARPHYEAAWKALQDAHDACFNHPDRSVLGLSCGPFSGVNQALEIIKKLETENARLRDEGPGTPVARLKAVSEYAIAQGLCTGVEAKPGELFLIEAYERLKLYIKDLQINSPAQAVIDENARLTESRDYWMNVAFELMAQKHAKAALGEPAKG